MEQIFKEYIYWEDYINGMYEFFEKNNEQKYVSLATKVLTDNDLFFKTCNEVVKNWPIATSVNLTNKSCNRQAWLGQASCNYKYNVPEICTRIAWGLLTYEQQINANKIASLIITKYEKENRKIHKRVGEQMLFKWDT